MVVVHNNNNRQYLVSQTRTRVSSLLLFFCLFTTSTMITPKPAAAAMNGNNNHKNGASVVPPVTMEEYTNFHGMVCSYKTAQRCIQSFEHGNILFLPSHYTKETLPNYDCSAPGMTTPFSYFLLVILSFTGLSTLLGLTTFRIAEEYNDEDNDDKKDKQSAVISSNYNSKLRVEPYVLEYCQQQTGASSLRLKRRFEYHFHLISIEVVMLHFQCNLDRLHLIEIYHVNNPIISKLAAPVLEWLGWFVRQIKKFFFPTKKSFKKEQ